MGFRHAAVLSASSFFLGVLFINFNVDRRILYSGSKPSEQDYADAFAYYTAFYEAPAAIHALLHSIMGIGILAIISKLHKWDESAIFFDGSSLAGFMFGVILYVSVGIPTLRTIVHPVPDVDTLEDQREALGVLSASNTMIILCLIGVLGLQAGQEYARKADAKELARVQMEIEKAGPDAVPETKKTK